MILWLRSLIFNVAFYGWTAFMCCVLLWGLLVPLDLMVKLIRVWLRQIAWIERHVGGIRYQVIGRENIPSGTCIIAAKHQSAWETFKLHLLFNNPAIVLKKELLNIPVWGRYLGNSGMIIPIDRAAGSKALAGMLEAAREAVKLGRKIIIFPEGTRVAPGDDRPYKGGVGVLYRELNIPVVPMALNSGLLWGKNSFIKKPGLITIEFLPPIPVGLPRDEMMKRLKAELDGASKALINK